ncbi:unnamed protein product [Sphenostylis stenocarpa]|uniref:Transmembrane protein n=1 Tax=Sphenostylis stenocarpa TaxID=92480 RepID=A0AA86VYF7_9FABA|nr:unnamed protein product [Sphenostylis stenocarpa]
MASISQGLVFTTAMLLSTTLLYLAFSKHKTSPQFQIPSNTNKQILRSCIYSEEKKRERKKKKKKVKFAKIVMVKEVERDSKEENREEEQGKQNIVLRNDCRSENPENGEMQANRIALYNGILRDRVQRMACCH